MEIIFYEKENGDAPAESFLLSLNSNLRAKMLRTIDMLEAKGNFLRGPESKLLEDGIFELKTTSGNNIARVLYFFAVGSKAILTNGFVKKTQKTPRKEINLAKKYRNNYLERMKNEIL